MGYIQEAEILLDETLCSEHPNEIKLREATIRFRDNIKLANSIISKFSDPYSSAVDKEDIIQSGYEGLWRACLSYEESRGYEFSTYAVPMIRGVILKMLRASDLLKTPRSYKDIRSSLKAHNFSLPLSDQEIDVLLSEGKFSRKQLLDYAEVEVLSLDRPINSDNPKGDANINLGDIIPSTYTSNFDSKLSEDELEEIIDHIILYIKPRYRELVEEWMYAALEGEKLTQDELSRKYHLSQPQIARVLKAATSIVKMHQEEIREMFGY